MGLEYDVRFRPGKDNVPADVLSRDCLNYTRAKECQRVIDAHESLFCHPGAERLWSAQR